MEWGLSNASTFDLSIKGFYWSFTEIQNNSVIDLLLYVLVPVSGGKTP